MFSFQTFKSNVQIYNIYKFSCYIAENITFNDRIFLTTLLFTMRLLLRRSIIHCKQYCNAEVDA